MAVNKITFFSPQLQSINDKQGIRDRMNECLLGTTDYICESQTWLSKDLKQDVYLSKGVVWVGNVKPL